MSKVFSKNQGPAVDVKRNTFDLSFASHLTGKLGKLIPCYCQEVIPGDSFQIDPKFGLRFNPTVFPIQSKVHGIMHFFYVRNRNLHDKWQEYITRTDDGIVHPYLSITPANAPNIIGTGTLGDYLGVPTTLTGEYARKLSVRLDTILTAEVLPFDNSLRRDFSPSHTFDSTALQLVNRKSPSFIYFYNDVFGGAIEHEIDYPVANWHNSGSSSDSSYGAVNWHKTYGYFSANQLYHPITIDSVTMSGSIGLGSTDMSLDKGAYIVFNVGRDTSSSLSLTNTLCCIPVVLQYTSSTQTITATYAEGYDLQTAFDSINSYIGTRSMFLGLVFDSSIADCANWLSAPSVLATDASFKSPADSLTFDVAGVSVLDATDPNTVDNNPFVLHLGESVPKIKLNALPFRAYEAIYNYFYRDETIDPFKINNKPTYNDFIPTHASGPDSTLYQLHERNWERDYYTSCTQSPQQGIAPLVGISASGVFKFSDGTNEYEATTTIGDDGETIVGISTYSPDMPKGSLRQLMDVITNGISINDLRNVNSFQRWLETNIRRGYKYVDQIYSHFGINPAFKANDMPEFIGGIHTIANVDQVTNFTSQGLGDYAGQVSMFGGSNNRINKFCDEHGYIIGIMCVFPEPCYSQMLPKHFLKTETPLDYFFPEFGHIGMQPVTYNEVTPLEVAAADAAAGEDTLNDVYGYQRAWADYLANNDQVHGDFRTSLSPFVMSRVFHGKPELGHDLIAIKDEDVDDVFVVQDGSDTIKGELRFDIKAQRPIPEYGIPRLE